MKLVGLISTAVLSLTLAVAAYAQHDEHADKQDRPQQHQDIREQSRHEQAGHQQGKPTQQHAQQQHQEQDRHEQHAQQSQRNNRPQDHAQQGSAPARQQGHHARQSEQRQEQSRQYDHAHQRDNQRPQRTEERRRIRDSAWQRHRSQHWDSDHRSWQQRGGYRGYRIPDARYRGYFGRDHGFRISGLPFLVVGGYPRFQYSGYWFSPVDPWPEYWATDWYDTDDVYVMYVDNGYYLYNRRYPTTGIAIRISL